MLYLNFGSFGFDTNWIFGIRWPTKLNSFYETLINYDQENIDRVERYGLEMLQIIMFDNRSYFQNITVWENFSDNNVSTLDSTGLINNVTSIKNLQQIIVDLQTQNNISIILCDHQARDLLSCVDLAVVLSNGKVIAKDTPNNLIKNIAAQNAYFGDSFKIN